MMEGTMSINENIKNEFNRRCSLDSVLTNAIIPMVIFVIGIVFKFDSLFDFRNDEISIFFRILFIVLIWLIIAMLLHSFSYLCTEVVIVHNNRLTDKERVCCMKDNLEYTLSFLKYYMFTIVGVSVFSYVFSKMSAKGLELIYNIFVFAFTLSVILAIVYVLVDYSKNRSLSRNYKHMNDKRVFIIMRGCIRTLLCSLLPMFIIWGLICYNNKMHININYYNDGLIKVDCDFDINEEDYLQVCLYDGDSSTISQIEPKRTLDFVELHVRGTDMRSTKSNTDYLNVMQNTFTPIDFHGFGFVSSFDFNLNDFDIDDMINEDSIKEHYLVEIMIKVRKHAFVVLNHFDFHEGTYEYANDIVNLSFSPISFQL